MSSEPVRPEARMKYVKYAGGTGLGWSRRICTLNAAAMGAVLSAAYSRGLTVDRESSGAIYVEGAGVYDPGFPMAGKPAPAWFVPHPIKETSVTTLPSQATSRWRVMQALADADAPLDRNELAERSGVNRSVVHTTLHSPLRAHWVVFASVPGSHTARKHVYAITARGSRALADHLKEFSS